MTTINLSSADLARLKVDALVVGVGTGEDGPVPTAGATSLDAALGGRLTATLTALGATGKAGEVTRFATLGATTAPVVVAVGLGALPANDAAGSSAGDGESVRRATGAAMRALAGTKKVAVALDVPDDAALRAIAEGALLGAYGFHRYRTQPNGSKSPVQAVTLVVPNARDKAVREAANRADVLARAVALARDLVNTAPGDLHPKELAEAAVASCSPHGLDVTVLDEKALRKSKFGGILGVGQGSANPPRLVRIAHRPARATKHVALVGKGITFDSGGLSIKPAGAMEWMKSDMAGAAAVLAALAAIGELGLPVNVTGFLACAENMPGGAAIRPSDVLVMYGGKTVEVLNTDAEGRLVLADAIVRAGEEKPDYLLDAATLTGAQLVALGSRTTGVMGNDDALRARVVDAAGRAGEPSWPMPLPEELRKELDSTVADLKNIAGNRNAGMLVAACFLREFVPDGVAWSHLDIAGPAYNQGEAFGYTPRGGTGAAVRTFVEFVQDVAAQS